MQRRKLTDWSEDYLWELKQRRGDRGKETWRGDASDIRRLAAWYDKTHRSPSSLDVIMIRGYLFGVRETGWLGLAANLAPRSFNNSLQRIKAFARWLEDQSVIKSSMRICAIENKEAVETEKHRIDRPQMRQMLSNASDDPWERWLLVVGLQTAGRSSEIRQLRRKHLRTESRKVQWYRPKTGKHDELTAMPMLLREAGTWMTYLAERGITLTDDSFLVPHRQKQGKTWRYFPHAPISGQTIGAVVKKHLLQFFTEDELQGEAAHVLRRSAARELYEVWKELGVPDPMRKVQALLGHSSITQTEVYIGIRRDREERNELMDGLDWLAVSDENVIDMEARRGHG